MCSHPQPVNQHEWRVVGMSRSGNHAIIDWILDMLPGGWCFLNCTEGKHNPFASARPLADGRPYRTDLTGFDLAAERRGEWQPKQHLLYSLEDNYLGNVHHRETERRLDGWVGTSGERRDLLILRDPFNLFASRLRDDTAQVSLGIAVRIWKQHAKEVLGMVRRLRPGRLVIDFDRWFLHQDHRDAVATRLGLPPGRDIPRRVATCNDGSSFDGMRFTGRADQMPVLDRWRAVADDERWRRLFDDEVHDLARRLYGDAEKLDLPLGATLDVG